LQENAKDSLTGTITPLIPMTILLDAVGYVLKLLIGLTGRSVQDFVAGRFHDDDRQWCRVLSCISLGATSNRANSSAIN
jgi:hypothetical protein